MLLPDTTPDPEFLLQQALAGRLLSDTGLSDEQEAALEAVAATAGTPAQAATVSVFRSLL